MAQWQELQNIDSKHQKEVIQVYAHQKFPWELRRFVRFWIEAQNWELVALDEQRARACYDELLQEVEGLYNHLVQQNNLLDGPNYFQLANNTRALFKADPVNMAWIISRCLSEERRIITSARTNVQECQIRLDDSIIELQKKIQSIYEQLGKHDSFLKSWQDQVKQLNRSQVSPQLQTRKINIDQMLNALTQARLMADFEIKSIEEGLGQHDFFLKAWQDEEKQLNGSPVSQQLQMRKGHIDQMLQVLTKARLDVCHLIGNTLKLAELVVSRVVDEELRSWRLRQQQACIGAPRDTSLHKLQTWFEAAVLALNLQLQQLRKLPELDLQSQPSETLLSQCVQTAQCLLTKLLKNALVVEKQPIGSPMRPLILKTGQRFSLKTRFLVNLSSFNLMPKVTLIFNKDFHEIGEVNGFRKFNFTQKTVSKLMDATEKTGLVAQFERLTLVEEKYKSKRQNESLLAVTEELHFITCAMELKLPGLETMAVETSTLPLVVISSAIQVHSAWASILWSAMAPDHQQKNLLFRTPPPVTWQQLSEVLGWQFQAMSKRGLNEQQLAMLKDKFVDEQVGLVTWNKFYKCDATWVWIEGILSLIKNHLQAIWRDGHIMGFISRDSASVLLQDKLPGTFLLRFSESQEGAITFSWVDHSTGVNRIHAVEPYKKELSNDNLADILHNYRLRDPNSRTVNPLLYLYPDTPMDQAFGQYYTKPAVNTNGYVPRNSGNWSVHPTPPPSPENHSMESSHSNMDPSHSNMDPSRSNMDLSRSNMDLSRSNMDLSRSNMDLSHSNIVDIVSHMDFSDTLELFPGLSGMGGPLPQNASPFTNTPLEDRDWTYQCDLSPW